MPSRTRGRNIVVGLVLLASTLVGGCAATSTTINDTQTIHNREATRIWVVRRNVSGDVTRDQVVYCDISMAQAGRDLCLTWGQ